MALGLAVLGLGIAIPWNADAATVRYSTDRQLIALSDRVVHGRVLDVRSERDDVAGVIVTIARVAVLEDLTGMMDPVIEVRELGGIVGDLQMHVPGVPRFIPGEELVLCLERRGAQWRTVSLTFSTFHIDRQPDGDPVLRRDLDAAEVVGVPSGAMVDATPRRLSTFRQLVAGVKGVSAVRPGGEHAIPRAPVSAPFTLLNNQRWRQADVDRPVFWYRNLSAQPYVIGGDVDALIPLAMRAWTDLPKARLILKYAGPRSMGGDTSLCARTAPDAGIITFEDPFDLVSRSTLAVGGGCSANPGHKHPTTGAYQGTMKYGFALFNRAVEIDAVYRTPENFAKLLSHELGHAIGLGHSIDQRSVMYPYCCDWPMPPMLGADDFAGAEFLYPMPSGAPLPLDDEDGDGLPTLWEADFGLAYSSTESPLSGADGDPDGDGLTNLQEFQQGSHPNGEHRRYFAEGVANSFFQTQFAVLNNATWSGNVLFRFQQQDGVEKTHRMAVGGYARQTVDAATIADLTTAPFSTLIESDVPIVVDRTVFWGTGAYGSHTETAVLEPATTWYLAEGATGGGFELYYLLHNSNNTAVDVDVTYLLPQGQAPIIKRYTVAARSRLTIWVDDEQMPAGSGNRPLSATDVSARLQVAGGGPPIIVERAMYFSTPNQVYAAGHESAGVPDLGQDRRNWFFAEGATGSVFDTYILLANPGSAPATVQANYLLTTGQTHQQTYSLGPESRFTIWLDEEEIPRGSGVKPLASVEVSTTIASDVPIVAERSMWWPQGAWYEAHNTAGATVSGTSWAVAEGELGGPQNAQAFLLVANVGDKPASIRVTVVTESGDRLEWPADFSRHVLPAHSRLTVPVDRQRFPDLPMHSRFGAIVDSYIGQPIVVERANYYNVPGGLWPSGGAALASRLRP